MKRALTLLLAALLAGAPSCSRLILDEEPENSPVANFEYLWEQCHQKYSFFAFKQIDWLEVHDRYRSQVSDAMTDEELFDLLARMLNELRDGHVNLFSPFNVSRYEMQLAAPENYDGRLLRENYWGDDAYYTGSFLNDFLAEGQIGYLRYSSFMDPVTDADLDYVLDRFANCRGLVLDVRGNGGGDVFNVFAIAERLTDQERLVYRSVTKTGPGPDDFSAPDDVYVKPEDGQKRFLGKVAVLTSRGCYSATNFLATILLEFPNVALVGDTTGGGGGAPSGGQLPNGWGYRFSVTQSFTLDGFNVEHGVHPQIPVWMDPASAARGRDDILEAAMAWILE